ncbi:mechanosensitive ion channel family protein [Aciduricibacillus chroicocephali]|uniref:Mechanosensitive ion channel family protein n=1 Tax=Aciduricibacillus chroicocephali TaxID=3054939 RepID=A0ABY9KYB0_9BACI|nr:mechanosensitive ion channel family protein [Bacillaceae bacterium 44XB]
MQKLFKQLTKNDDSWVAVFLSNSLIIVVLIVLFLILLPVGKKIISKVLTKTGNSKKIKPGRIKTLEKLLSNVYFYILFFILIIMIFDVLKIPIGPLLAGAGVVGLAIGFGAQGIVSDVVTGFFILLEWQLEIDDYVTIGSVDGIVEEVGLRTTKIRSFDGTLNYIPNRNITNVANHSRGNMRALVDFTVPRDKEIDRALAILEDVCAHFRNDIRFTDGPHLLGVQNLDASNAVLRIVGQTASGQQFQCERDIRKQIQLAFEKEQQQSKDQNEEG